MVKKAAIRPMRTLPCACASVRRLARAMTQVYDRALRPCGLETAQFTLLQALEEVGPVTQGRLGQALALDSTTLSRTLKPLEDRKWIVSEVGDDRRQRLISISRQGRAHLERATPAWARVQSRLRAGVGSERWDALLAELAELAAVARES